MAFKYESGEEVRKGDRIIYHGEPGKIEFVVSEAVGNPSMDWYVQQFPGGGFMLSAASFGDVFLTESDIDEDLHFIARESTSSA